MKKLFYPFMVAALSSAVLFTSCKKDEEEPTPDPTKTCADYTFPTADGDATIQVLNYTGTTIQVEAGGVLAMAVQVTKGTSRTKKLRLFESDCVNQLGTEIDLSDQPKGGKNGIDLRNTDDAQVRNVNYQIPTGMDPIYLTIQIDEGGGKTNYLTLTLNVTGSGIVDTWSNIILGGNSNTTAGPNSDGASRLSSGTGLTYSACNAAANIDYIDITYAVSKTPSDPTPGTCAGQTNYLSFLSSNPARFNCPIGLATSTRTDCDDEGTVYSTAGGKDSYFVPYTGSLTFSDFDNTELEALAVDNTNDDHVQVMAAGDMFEFMSPDGNKGIIEVVGFDGTYGINDARGYIEINVKIQR